MEKDNVKENETEVTTKERKQNVDISKESENNTNSELKDLIEGNEKVNDSEGDKESSFGKETFANILDQFIILACSSIILLMTDLIMRVFGYQFVREGGVLAMVVMFIYFVINCFYEQLLKKTKLKNTIAKRILNL